MTPISMSRWFRLQNCAFWQKRENAILVLANALVFVCLSLLFWLSDLELPPPVIFIPKTRGRRPSRRCRGTNLYSSRPLRRRQRLRSQRLKCCHTSPQSYHLHL